MKFFTEQRIAILVDNQNIFLYSKSLNMRPDYGRILKAVEGRKIIRAIIYSIQPELTDQSKFFYAVENMGYEIKSKAPHLLPDGTHKADWDMEIAIDALALAEKVDTILIVSGDGDFIPLCWALKAKGVKVESMSFVRIASSELMKIVDWFHPMREEEFLLKIVNKEEIL